MTDAEKGGTDMKLFQLDGLRPGAFGAKPKNSSSARLESVVPQATGNPDIHVWHEIDQFDSDTPSALEAALDSAIAYLRSAVNWAYYKTCDSRIDIEKTDDAYRIEIDVSGIRAQQWLVRIRNTTVTVRSRTRVVIAEGSDGINTAAFRRTLALPTDADMGKVVASLTEHRLRLVIPRTRLRPRATDSINVQATA